MKVKYWAYLGADSIESLPGCETFKQAVSKADEIYGCEYVDILDRDELMNIQEAIKFALQAAQ